MNEKQASMREVGEFFNLVFGDGNCDVELSTQAHGVIRRRLQTLLWLMGASDTETPEPAFDLREDGEVVERLAESLFSRTIEGESRQAADRYVRYKRPRMPRRAQGEIDHIRAAIEQAMNRTKDQAPK